MLKNLERKITSPFKTKSADYKAEKVQIFPFTLFNMGNPSDYSAYEDFHAITSPVSC